MKQVGILLVVCSIFWYGANALVCYECESTKPNISCFNPIDENKVPSDVCKLASGEPATFACVAFEMFESESNKHTYRRSCMRKIGQITACSNVENSGAFKNVSSCKECETDKCNHFRQPNHGSSPIPTAFSAFILLFVMYISL